MSAQVLRNNKQVVTMSSREISELVDSRHDTVKVCIERLTARGAIQLPLLTEVWIKDDAQWAATCDPVQIHLPRGFEVTE